MKKSVQNDSFSDFKKSVYTQNWNGILSTGRIYKNNWITESPSSDSPCWISLAQGPPEL